MSTVSATLIPRQPHIPYLLPEPTKPHPIPLAPSWSKAQSTWNLRRTLADELDELSEDEAELDEIWKTTVKNRGFNFLHIIGRMATQQEEKNDAESESDASGSMHSEGMNSNPEDGENETGEDLDANMDDLDEEGGTEEPDENDDVEVQDEDEP